MHVCTKCKDQKTPEEMSRDKSRKNGLSSWCKSCRLDSQRAWKTKNTGRLSQRKPLSYDVQRNYMLKLRYGITSDDYDLRLKEQNYKCAICEVDSREMTYLLHVDHCHNTNKVRGLLCSPCNVYLGKIKDNLQVYHNGIRYLKKYQGE